MVHIDFYLRVAGDLRIELPHPITEGVSSSRTIREAPFQFLNYQYIHEFWPQLSPHPTPWNYYIEGEIMKAPEAGQYRLQDTRII